MNIYICELKEKEWKAPLLCAASHAGLLESSEAKALWQNEKKLQNQREHLTAWLLFYRVLRVSYGIRTISELALLNTEHGKPYSRTYPGLHFNLSHCRTACACVLDTVPVGIDIERRFPYKENLMRRICTEKERRILEECKELPERERLLQVLWSMKESIVKWNGRGLGYGMARIDCAMWLSWYKEQWKNERAEELFSASAEKIPIWQPPDKERKEEGSDRKDTGPIRLSSLQMTAYQERKYTVAACLTGQEGVSDNRGGRIQSIKIGEEELWRGSR